jgi:hypothetical protein
MQQYIYFNDKEAHFFTAQDNNSARQKVINTFDLSYNASFLPININIIDEKNVQFSVKNSLLSLRLKNHFKLIGTGNNLFIYSVEPKK